MIQISHLDYKYMGAKSHVFNDFDLTLSNNNIYGLLGKNGMGKSTLLYLMCGLLRPERGTITIDDYDVKQHNPELLSKLFFVPEEFELLPVSLKEYIKVNRDFYPHFSMDILKQCLNDFGLPLDVHLKELSMGQKKKVYMSFALATNTQYLLMDEPTNGLDIPSKSEFRKIIARNMSDERTLIISTHQVHDVESLLDHILILDHSHMLLNASVADICEQYTFEFRTVNQMDDSVIYSEPSLQGNAVIAHKTSPGKETTLNMERLCNAVTNGIIK